MNSKEDAWTNIIAPIIVMLIGTILITSIDNLSGTFKLILFIDMIFIIFCYYYSKNNEFSHKSTGFFALIFVLLFLITIMGVWTEIKNGHDKSNETPTLLEQVDPVVTTTEVSYNEWNGKIIPDIGGTSSTGETSDTGVCYYDWKGTILGNLTGTYNPDYTYFMVTLYIKNDASQPVSTNAWYWKLVVDGVEYSRDMNSFGSTYQTPVEIQNGGEKETRIIYCLNSIPSEAEVIYKRPSTPIMERVKNY